MTNTLDWAVKGPPIGLWKTVTGTADMLMQDTLCLMADGTGYLLRLSTMRGEDKFPVMWKHPRAGTLSMAVLYPWDDPSEEPAWETIRYRSSAIDIDTAGAHVDVLRNVLDNNFWDLVGPIALVSHVPTRAQ